MDVGDWFSEVAAGLRWSVLLSGDRRLVTVVLPVASYVLRVTDVASGEFQGIGRDRRELD